LRNFGEFTTEQSVARFINAEIRALGLKPSFKAIVGSAEGGSEPHHKPKNTPIKKGFCIIDFGLKVNGYCSDLTRTVYIGKPSKRDRQFYALVRAAQQKPLPSIKHGAKGSALFEISAKRLGKYRKNFIHGLGHGLGKHIHIKPYLKSTSFDVLKEGDIITIEPGVYFKDKFGIRVEDDYLVTRNGARLLTKATNKLVVLPLPSENKRNSKGAK
jgi:Xaa-Pro aminopeptidase